jgi:hypothetical protein
MSGHGMYGMPGPHGRPGMWHGGNPALKGLRIAGMVVLGVIGAALFALVFGWLVMILWNWLMPMIFHLGEITYWQSFGIVILAKLLFGGIGGPRGHGRGRGPWKGGPWGGNPWEGRHGRDDWRLYHDFWEQEGREAFERYRQKKDAEGGAASPGGSSGGGSPTTSA